MYSKSCEHSAYAVPIPTPAPKEMVATLLIGDPDQFVAKKIITNMILWKISRRVKAAHIAQDILL